MSYPHVIRLRGPWECQPLARYSLAPDGTVVETASDLAGASREKLPADWADTLGHDFRGRVRYTRRFNRPTNLAAGERVWLVVEGVDARGRLALDGQDLGANDGYALPAENDITALLQPSSVLTVDVELPPTGSGQNPVIRPGRESLAGGLIGEVRLEIRKHAYVVDLAMHWQAGAPPQLQIAGRVAGSPEDAAPGGRLAIVVSACERELAYQDVVAGASFALSIPIGDWPAWPDPMDEPVLTPVEIRLSDGRATLWQTTLETAPCQPASEPARAGMLARLQDGAPLGWLDYVDREDAAFQKTLAQPGAVIGLRGVLPDKAYQALDRANVGVVQAIPWAWADRVCPRLAHHPAIVAWAVSPADHALAGEWPPADTLGRPWLRIG